MQLRRALPRLRALRRVRRGAALLMLLVLAVFLAAGSHDHCGEAHDHGPAALAQCADRTDDRRAEPLDQAQVGR